MADAVDNSIKPIAKHTTHQKKYPKNRNQKKEPSSNDSRAIQGDKAKKIYYTPLYYSGGYTGAKRGRKSNAEREEKQKNIEDERFRFEIKRTVIVFD